MYLGYIDKYGLRAMGFHYLGYMDNGCGANHEVRGGKRLPWCEEVEGALDHVQKVECYCFFILFFV